MSLLTIIASLCGSSTSGGGGTGGGGTTPSHAKNVRNLSGESLGAQDYIAFGGIAFCDTHLTQITRVGTGHETGGKWYKRTIPLDTLTPGTWSLLYTHTYNLEDCYVTRQGSYLYVHGSASDDDRTGLGWDTRECFYLKCDLDGNLISGPHDTINGTSGVTSGCNRNWPFGRGGWLGTGNWYGQSYVSLQYDGTTVSDGKIWFFRTQDDWATFEAFAYYTGTAVDEVLLIPFTDGRAVSLRRQAGKTNLFRCPNTLATTPSWSLYSQIDLGWYHYGTLIPTYDIHDNLIDIVFADRDTGMISISRNNTYDNVYNGIFNDEEIIAYANIDSAGSAYTPLGYPVYVYNCGVSSYGGVLSFVGWSEETAWSSTAGSDGSAQFWGTFLDFEHDETGALPTQPPTLVSDPSYLASTSARVKITGYTLDQIANIKYFLWDMSSSPSFAPGTFLTQEIEWVQPPVLVKDQRIPGIYLAPVDLTSGTTYYVRVKAVNHAGESAYTSTSFTTP